MEDIKSSDFWNQAASLNYKHGTFLRSEEVSAKDGEFFDRPITSCEELLRHLLTSKRMMGTFRRFLGINM
jgi:hypothetical protein